ncbi:MAG: sulfatase-like hydrolase/transferase, partial [Proteobacteria bacterium]|nr:sulfatase-like hydrolase/transferase [Pseudomonadota bacterium]
LEDDVPPVVMYREVFANIQKTLDDTMKRRTAYAEMIVEIDKQIGRVISKLESLGLMENTTFIFSADHGDMLGDLRLDANLSFQVKKIF